MGTRPRWIKIMRDMWLYKARTAIVVISIALGVALYGVMGTGQIIMGQSMATAYRDSNPAEGVLQVDDFSPEMLAQIRNLPGVQGVEIRHIHSAKIQLSAEEWTTLELQAIPDFDRWQISTLVPEEGAAEPPRGSLIMERSGAMLGGFEVGDTVQIRLPMGEVRTLQIAGTGNDFGTIPSTIEPTIYGYISMETLEELRLPPRFTHLYIDVEGEPQSRAPIETVLTRVAETVEAHGFRVLDTTIPTPQTQIMQGRLDTTLLILGTMGSLSLLLSAFMVTNLMAAVMLQQVKEIGVLKSLGGRVRQVFELYIAMVAIFGLLALLLAVPLGLIGAYILGVFVGLSMDIDVINFTLPPRILALQIGGALVLPILAALLPIREGAMLSIRDAIGGYRMTASHTGLIERVLARLPNLPRLVLLSVRNVFRQRTRLFLTLAALILAGGMVIAMLGVRQAIFAGTELIYQQRAYNIEIDLARPYPREQIERLAGEVEGVAQVETRGIFRAQPIFADGRRGGSFLLLGMQPETPLYVPYLQAGRWLTPQDTRGIVVTDDVIQQLVPQPQVGDTLTLRVNGQDSAWEIIGITARQDVAIAYMDRAAWEQITGLAESANRLVIVTQGTVADESAIERRLLDRLAEQDIQVRRSETTGKSREITRPQVGSLVALLLAIAGLVAVVGMLSLGSTMSLNVLERTREIGILRSLGAKNSMIRRVVIVESLTIAWISCILCLAVAIPLEMYFCRVLGEALYARPLDFIFPWSGIVIWVGLLTFMAVIASLIPAQNAVNLTIRDTLNYEG